MRKDDLKKAVAKEVRRACDRISKMEYKAEPYEQYEMLLEYYGATCINDFAYHNDIIDTNTHHYYMAKIEQAHTNYFKQDKTYYHASRNNEA